MPVDKYNVNIDTRHDLQSMYKQHQACYWTAEEIDLGKDLADWLYKLNDDERYFVSNILAFFANSDAIVAENLAERFLRDTTMAEAKSFYALQLFMEIIHNETYNLLIDTYIRDKDEKKKLFNAIENVDCIKKKGEWMMKWIVSNESYPTRLVAFAIVEGIFFSGAFAAIFWLKKRGLLPGLAFSNELISRDEGLHTKFACMMYNNYVEEKDKLAPEKIVQIFKEAVELEMEFFNDSLPVDLIGMNAKSMNEYVQYVADHLLEELNYDKIYNVLNPFDFMTSISLEGKTNFFEKRVSEYRKSGFSEAMEDKQFTLDADF